MGWSTREIAGLAGTSLRAVRHYHKVGLLEEPPRRANGYKQYGVDHLVRLLRINRLTGLGFSLSQVSAMGGDDEHPEEAMRGLDAELAATIERLQRVRVDLGLTLRHSVPTDLPVELASVAGVSRLSAADRSLVVVLSRALGPRGLRTVADMLRSYPDDPASDEFDALPADADEQVRLDLAERLAPFIRGVQERNPGLRDLCADAPGGAGSLRRIAAVAVRDLYNPAQLDVLRQAHSLLASLSVHR